MPNNRLWINKPVPFSFSPPSLPVSLLLTPLPFVFSLSLSLPLFVSLSLSCLSLSLSTSLSLSVYLALSFCLSVCLTVCLCLSVCLSVCLSLSFSLSFSISFALSLFLSPLSSFPPCIDEHGKRESELETIRVRASQVANIDVMAAWPALVHMLHCMLTWKFHLHTQSINTCTALYVTH